MGELKNWGEASDNVKVGNKMRNHWLSVLIAPQGGPQNDGGQYWHENGTLHREDGPAAILYDGSEFWYRHGNLHRVGGPAATKADGSTYWYQNGGFHREDGPAVTWGDGTEFWYRHGNLHRDDGPAVRWADGQQEWWLNGNRFSEGELEIIMSIRNLKRITLKPEDVAYAQGDSLILTEKFNYQYLALKVSKQRMAEIIKIVFLEKKNVMISSEEVVVSRG